MRYCPRCSVPRILTNEHRWGSNGTLFLANDPTHRMVVLDNEALENVFNSIAGHIGIPVTSIVAEAKRKSGHHFMDAVLSGLKGVIARNLASKKVYDRLSDQVSMLGYGRAAVVRYERGRMLEGRVTDVYNGAAMTGDIAGAFESVEKKTCDYQFEVDGEGTLNLVINADGHQSEEFEGRFGYEPPDPLPGDDIFELCPVCHAPLQIGRQYSFDSDRGVIHDTKTGHRVVLLGVMTLNNLFGELESELGDEIPNMIMAIERERVRDVITAKSKDLDASEAGYLRYMRTLRIKGMGSGTEARVGKGGVTVRIENPYYEPLLAGFISGFFEATAGVGSKASWTPAGAGSTEITVGPA